MKKLLLLAFVALLLPALCQVPANTRNNYSELLRCDSTILRSDGADIVVCCHYPQESVSHRFSVRTSQSSARKVLEMPAYNNEHGPIIDRVCDMRILDTMCYFCGTRLTPEYSEGIMGLDGHTHAEVIYTPHGFMGYFSIPAVLRGQGTYHFNTIDNLATASRMAVYEIASERCTGVSILGTQAGTSGTTCLAELANSASSPDMWDYAVGRPAQADEVMTDITATAGALELASIFSGDNEIIGFRESKQERHGFSNPASVTGSSSDTQHPSLGLTLRAGLYFVTLSTPQGSSTQKLVVQ